MSTVPGKSKIGILAIESVSSGSISLLLSQVDDLKISGVTSTDAEAIEILGRGGTEVVVIDMALSGIDTLELIKKVRDSAPSARVLVVTASDDPQEIFAALDAGADGYVLKNGLKETLEDAVHSVKLGAVWLDPGIARQLVHVIETSKPKKNTRILPTGLITIPLFPDEKTRLAELASASCKDGVCMIDPGFLKKLRNLAQAQA